MNYLESLNSEQKKAVLAVSGPVMIVAGAGAGKTKTLTYRILHLIKSGISADKILAITFTNKAAKEMRDRVLSLLRGTEKITRAPLVSTFHSLGVQIIKENAEILGLPRHFNIFDKSDSKKVLKESLLDLGIDPKEHLETIEHIISREKSRGTTVSEFLDLGFEDYKTNLAKKAWAKYEQILKREKALDFDDLLLKSLKLLQKPDILEIYQERFLYIHVDEYQDTNKVQNEIISLLAQKHKNLCVVGDIDQNIYSWRGADSKFMLRFEKTFPETQTIFLEQNYRSTKNILGAANEVIKKNTFRIPKNLFTENPNGEKISTYEARNEVDEAYFIAFRCQSFLESGLNPEKIAVLYRANFQSRVLEEAFVSLKVPYQMLGVKFFERKEIKDILAFVKASLENENLNGFARIINIPTRGIGKVTLQKIIGGEENKLPEKLRIKIGNFRKMLADFKEKLLKEKPSESLRYIIETSGIKNMYKTGLEEDLERLENVMELVSLASSYDQYEGEEGIEKFLTDAALASDQDSLSENKSGVKLMTVHSSKGLEFDYVFVSGLEDGLFPHQRANENKKSGDEGEEERRLFYVAITRAAKKLSLTWAQARTIFGTLEINSPSEFLGDIPEKYTEKELNAIPIYENMRMKQIDF